MKRERERIRDLLIRLEADPYGQLIVGGTLNMPDEELKDEYHLNLMANEGLVVQTGDAVWSLSAVGHDAVEALGKNAFWAQLMEASPKEAYDLVKGTTSSLAVAAISKVMGWG